MFSYDISGNALATLTGLVSDRSAAIFSTLTVL